jgi:hypothetical protein
MNKKETAIELLRHDLERWMNMLDDAESDDDNEATQVIAHRIGEITFELEQERRRAN